MSFWRPQSLTEQSATVIVKLRTRGRLSWESEQKSTYVRETQGIIDVIYVPVSWKAVPSVLCRSSKFPLDVLLWRCSHGGMVCSAGRQLLNRTGHLSLSTWQLSLQNGLLTLTTIDNFFVVGTAPCNVIRVTPLLATRHQWHPRSCDNPKYL